MCAHAQGAEILITRSGRSGRTTTKAHPTNRPAPTAKSAPCSRRGVRLATLAVVDAFVCLFVCSFVPLLACFVGILCKIVSQLFQSP